MFKFNFKDVKVLHRFTITLYHIDIIQVRSRIVYCGEPRREDKFSVVFDR